MIIVDTSIYKGCCMILIRRQPEDVKCDVIGGDYQIIEVNPWEAVGQDGIIVRCWPSW